jgi:hypothetical protein
MDSRVRGNDSGKALAAKESDSSQNDKKFSRKDAEGAKEILA